VDDMRHVEVRNMALHLHLHVVVVVCMVADVEIARDLLNRKIANQPAAIPISESLSYHLQLFMRTMLPQQLETPAVQVISISVQPPFLNRTDIGMMRDHDVHQIERDQFTGKGRKLNVQVDPIYLHLYVIS